MHYQSTFFQGGADLQSKFASQMMEPRLMIFHDDESIQQMAENTVVLELPTNELVDGFIHFMATYYVFNVQYPNFCKGSLFFLQDILMAMPDTGTHRPTRYSTFVTNFMKKN